MALHLKSIAKSIYPLVFKCVGLSFAAIIALNSAIPQAVDGQQPTVDPIDDNESQPSKITGEKDGYQNIFNGQDFDGWAGDIDGYVIQNGVLRNKPQRGGTIFTEKEWSDFSVRFKFRLPSGGNNGLAIRYPGSGDTAYVGMCELQILDNTADEFKDLDPRQMHGSVYGVVAAKTGHLRPVGQWNEQEVTVIGTKIKVELNGTVILDTDVAEFLNPEAKFLDDKLHPGLARTKGHFGFAGHNDPVEFKEIYLRDLSQQK